VLPSPTWLSTQIRPFVRFDDSLRDRLARARFLDGSDLACQKRTEYVRELARPDARASVDYTKSHFPVDVLRTNGDTPGARRELHRIPTRSTIPAELSPRRPARAADRLRCVPQALSCCPPPADAACPIVSLTSVAGNSGFRSVVSRPDSIRYIQKVLDHPVHAVGGAAHDLCCLRSSTRSKRSCLEHQA